MAHVRRWLPFRLTLPCLDVWLRLNKKAVAGFIIGTETGCINAILFWKIWSLICPSVVKNECEDRASLPWNITKVRRYYWRFAHCSWYWLLCNIIVIFLHRCFITKSEVGQALDWHKRRKTGQISVVSIRLILNIFGFVVRCCLYWSAHRAFLVELE